MINETLDIKRLQCVVAFRCFYRKENGRCEIVIMNCDEHIDATDISRPRYFSVWFSKVLAFLRILKRASTKCLSSKFLKTSESMEFHNGESLSGEGVRFGQYFEVCGSNKLEKNKIDKTRRCVRLRWQIWFKELDDLSTGKDRFVPIASIRDTINLVRRNTMLSVIDNLVDRAASQFHAYQGVKGWENCSFYGYRFSYMIIEKSFRRQENVNKSGNVNFHFQL